MTQYYAGIGSRSTPELTLGLFTGLALMLTNMYYTLRSGGANGADTAFERGVFFTNNKDIYLPWAAFNNNQSTLCKSSPEAYKMAAHYHPNWGACSQTARSFHARNCHQILGDDLETPVIAVVCWTPDGKVTGGTGQALRIALDKDIPIYNFGEYNDQALALIDTYQFFKDNQETIA